MDNKSKRLFRLASKELFNLVQYNDFTIYFARKSTLPAIADRLSSYSWPIQLTFKKIVYLTTEDILEHLYKITSLISLEVDSDDWSPLHDEPEVWMRLSTLTNLQRFNVLNARKLLLPNYTNLTSLSYSGNKPLDKFLDRATNLKELVLPNLQLENIPQKSSVEVLGKLARLTHLEMNSFAKLEVTLDLRSLKRLKCLNVFCDSTTVNIDDLLELQKLHLGVKTNQIGNVNRCTNLTEVTLESVNMEPLSLNNLKLLQCYNSFSYTTSISELSPDSLTRLVAAPASLHHGATRLTNLRELDISGDPELDVEMLSCLTKLTRLALDQHRGDFTKLINLQDLDIMTNHSPDYYVPTTLKSLKCYDVNPRSFELFPRIPNLTSLTINLQYLTDYCMDSEEVWNIMLKLTNLQILDLAVGDEDRHWSKVENLTNLTYLTLTGRVTTDSFVNSTTKLTNMQLLRLCSYNQPIAKIDVANYSHFPYLYRHNFQVMPTPMTEDMDMT